MGKVLLFKPSTYSGANYGAALTRRPSEPTYPRKPVRTPGMTDRLYSVLVKEWLVKTAAMKEAYAAELAAWEASQAAAAQRKVPGMTVSVRGSETRGTMPPGTEAPVPESSAEIYVDEYVVEAPTMMDRVKTYAPYALALGGVYALLRWKKVL